MASFGGRSELFICSWFIASSEPGLRAHYATEAVLQPPAAGRPNVVSTGGELPVLLSQRAPVAEEMGEAVRQGRFRQAILRPELSAVPPRVRPPHAEISGNEVDEADTAPL
jgi:hypothetical protein